MKNQTRRTALKTLGATCAAISLPSIRARKINGVAGDRTTETWPVGHGISESPSSTALKVMTWNIWGRLNQDPRYTIDKKTARERTIEIIRESGADIVAMIETDGSAADIAMSLGIS